MNVKLLPFLALLWTPWAPSQEPDPPPAWFSQPIHDAGRRLEGSVITHHFRFRNPHPEPRTIRWMMKTCDCAAAFLVIEGRKIPADSVREQPVAVPPGGEGAVELVVSVTERSELEATATLGFDQSDASPHLVSLRVIGEGLFKVSPPAIALGTLLPGAPREFSFTITSAYLETWALAGVDSVPPGITLSEPQRTQTEGRVSYTIRGYFDPGLPPGLAGGVIRLKADQGKRPIEMRVTAEVKAPYRVTPSGYLHFGLVRRAEGSQPRSILIVDEDPGHDLVLLEATLEGLNRPSRWVRVERKPAGRGRFELVLTVLPGVPQGPLRGRLLLRLSHPQSSVHRIEFGAIVR